MGRGFLLALAGGEDFSHEDGWSICTPHFLFFFCEEIEKTGRARSKREKEGFWQLRKLSALIEKRSANLLRGRMDVFLFPRFVLAGPVRGREFVYRRQEGGPARMC